MFFEGCVKDLGSIPDRLISDALELIMSVDRFTNRSIGVMKDTRVMKALTPSNFDRIGDVDTEKLLLSSLTPLFYQALRGTEKLIYLDVSLVPPGASMELHVDWALSHVMARRIHVPIVTDPLVKMGFITHEGMFAEHLQRGKIYEVNNEVPHSVYNGSTIDRIHVVADVMDAEVHEMLVRKNLLLSTAFGSVQNRCFGELVKKKLYTLMGRRYEMQLGGSPATA